MQSVINCVQKLRTGLNAGRFAIITRKLETEPTYLDEKPDEPTYKPLDINLKGYDFVTVESFAKYVHHLTAELGIESKMFPVPARSYGVSSFKPNSNNIESVYDLTMYHRTIQVTDMKSRIAPILIEAMQLNVPQGVDITVKYPEPEETEFRYVPSVQIQDLMTQIAAIDESIAEKKG